MSLTPEFWTNLTILLDVPYFSAAFITSILVRSHNLILESVTCTRNDWSAVYDECERARVMTAMQTIAPHMHRCRSITFIDRFSSSLPFFPNDFHGNAEHLKTLQLCCLEDDGGAISVVGEMDLPPVHHERFQCPNLTTLAIDGRTYFNACRQNLLNSWTEIFPAISSISISRFTPVATRSESFTTSDLLYSLAPFQNHLKFLGLTDLHLDQSHTHILDDNDWFNGQLHFNKIETIALKNMHRMECIYEILEVLGDDVNLHLTRCPLDSIYTFGGYLSLKDIDGGENLASVLSGCPSDTLVIDACPSFTDKVLDAMVTPNSPAGIYTPPDCAPHVEDLSISNCVNFSISTLKKVVENRLSCQCLDDDFCEEPPRIYALRLSGRVPDMSLEDEEWFKAHVQSNPLMLSCFRYVHSPVPFDIVCFHCDTQYLSTATTGTVHSNGLRNLVWSSPSPQATSLPPTRPCPEVPPSSAESIPLYSFPPLARQPKSASPDS